MTKWLMAASAALLSVAAASASAQSLSFGVGLTTDYHSRGITQSANNPAIQPWVEYEASGFYVGVWASNISFGADTIETDLYGGYRWDAGATSLDVGYARYYYNRSGDQGGELYLLLSHAVSEGSSLFGGVYVNPAASFQANDVHVGVSVPLMASLSGSVRLGLNPTTSATYGNIGVTYDASEMISLDARVYGSNTTAARFVLSTAISF